MNLTKNIRSAVIIPLPKSISAIWNFGSILGLSIAVQIITGLILAIHYTVNPGFEGLVHILRDVPAGWALRLIHTNGASLYFVLIFLHVGRALYYKRWITQKFTFLIGIFIILVSIAVAFLGYVLPWGQIRYWGATVITNLIRAIPYLGPSIVTWVWGGFTVSTYTLSRFYVLHFSLPFVIVAFVVAHIFFLHNNGRTNPLGNLDHTRKIPLHPYFTWKDLVGFSLMGIGFAIAVNFAGYSFMDPENFTMANSITTPVHIQPEWYFLFAYAILRCIPRKAGGVLGLIAAVIVFLVIPFLNKKLQKTTAFSVTQQITFWTFVIVFIILTFLGAQPVEEPYVFLSRVFSILYFLLIAIICAL